MKKLINLVNGNKQTWQFDGYLLFLIGFSPYLIND